MPAWIRQTGTDGFHVAVRDLQSQTPHLVLVCNEDRFIHCICNAVFYCHKMKINIANDVNILAGYFIFFTMMQHLQPQHIQGSEGRPADIAPAVVTKMK